MNYEEKYKEALERASKLMVQNQFDTVGQMMGHVFPELKEGKKEWIEKIRQELKSYLEHREIKLISESDAILQWIDWIEKQGDQNVPSVNEHAWLYLVSDVLTWKDGIGQYLDNPRVQELAKKLASEYAQKLYNYPVSSNLDNRQNNYQELVDKDEAKFHEGDWIISNNKKYIYQVVKVMRGIYVVRDNADNREYHVGIESADRDGRLWTIQDATDGDVLVEASCTFIIKKINHDPGLSAKIYYCLFDDGDFDINTTLVFDDTSTHPATKEQRDNLIIAMTDSGYMFDFEKKELKKLG